MYGNHWAGDDLLHSVPGRPTKAAKLSLTIKGSFVKHNFCLESMYTINLE